MIQESPIRVFENRVFCLLAAWPEDQRLDLDKLAALAALERAKLESVLSSLADKQLVRRASHGTPQQEIFEINTEGGHGGLANMLKARKKHNKGWLCVSQPRTT